MMNRHSCSKCPFGDQYDCTMYIATAYRKLYRKWCEEHGYVVAVPITAYKDRKKDGDE